MSSGRTVAETPRSAGLLYSTAVQPTAAASPSTQATSVVLDGGESVKALSEYQGHADPGFTLRTYIHLSPSSEARTKPRDGRSGCLTGIRPSDGPARTRPALMAFDSWKDRHRFSADQPPPLRGRASADLSAWVDVAHGAGRPTDQGDA